MFCPEIIGSVTISAFSRGYIDCVTLLLALILTFDLELWPPSIAWIDCIAFFANAVANER